MQIIVPKFKVDITGKVHLVVLNQKGQTKIEQHFSNAIEDDLKNAIVTHMGSSSGASAYHINTSSNWFAGEHQLQTGSDGIFIHAPGASSESQVSYESSGTNYFDMKLSESTSTSYSTNSCSWTAQGTYTGSGNGTSGSMTSMGIGKGFAYSGSTPGFTTDFASATSGASDFTAFTLDQLDVARVTWTITIN